MAMFTDIWTKNQISGVARDKGYLLHKAGQVSFFLDLTPETLQKMKELKEVSAAALLEANIWHWWATPLKLQILYKGK